MITVTTPPSFEEPRDDAEWSVFDRYFGGEGSAEERAAIERWACAAPANARLLEVLRRGWTEAGTARPPIDEERGWEALQARIVAARRSAGGSRPLRIVPPSMKAGRGISAGAIAAAAGLLVAAAIGGGVWLHVGRPAASMEHAREYVTAKGQRSEIALLDGTRVWLSVDSRLRVPDSYGARSREVALEGEAFFEVAHDARRPFRVRTPSSLSEDLGTAFSVRDYADDPEAVVVVASGKVGLHADGRDAAGGRGGVELTRGQMGRLAPDGRIVVVDGVDLAALHAWRQGRLDFEEEPLGVAARRLERWFDVEIVLGDSALAGVPITASFAGQSVDDAMKVLAAVLDLDVQRDGRRVRIAPRRPP